MWSSWSVVVTVNSISAAADVVSGATQVNMWLTSATSLPLRAAFIQTLKTKVAGAPSITCLWIIHGVSYSDCCFFFRELAGSACSQTVYYHFLWSFVFPFLLWCLSSFHCQANSHFVLKDRDDLSAEKHHLCGSAWNNVCWVENSWRLPGPWLFIHGTFSITFIFILKLTVGNGPFLFWPCSPRPYASQGGGIHRTAPASKAPCV